MPLARFRVKNEYGLGAPELYRTENSEDPKAILDGVAVAGLVGILRQLGDLAEFASEVFHDLQERVVATASRSHKMMVRVQNIESVLPPLEKAVMSQSSHLHFAYTAGSDWRHKVRIEKNQLIYSDLPQFIVDSYEECRDPPRLHLLDKFDIGGSGACMKRYSNPSFFRSVLSSSESTDKFKREKKTRKTKKRGSRHRNGEISRVGSTAGQSGRMQFATLDRKGQSSAGETVPLRDVSSNSGLRDHSMSFDSRCMSGMLFASPTTNGQSSDAETISLFEVRSNSELQDLSPSFDPISKMGCTEFVLDGRSSIQTEKQDSEESVTSRLKTECSETLHTVPDKLNGTMDNDLTHGSLQEQGAQNSSFVTWDEKTEILKSEFLQCDDINDGQCEASELQTTSSGINILVKETSLLGYGNSNEILFVNENMPASVTTGYQFDEVESELDNYMDALNTMESEIETDTECQTKREVDCMSFNFEGSDMEFEAGKMERTIGQNSDSSDTETRNRSYSSSSEEVSPISNKVTTAEGLPDPESPQINGISFPQTDTECQTKQEVDCTLFDFESTDMEFGAGKMVKTIGQNSDSSDTETRNPTYNSSSEEMSRISNKVIAAEGLPDPESPQITGISLPQTDTECQTKQKVDCTLFDIESIDMEFGAGKMVKTIGQNLDSSDTETCNPTYSSSSEEISRFSNKVIAAEGLPDPESAQITSIPFPHADTEYQTKREVDYTLFDFESTDMEFGAGKMVKGIGQNLDSSDTETCNPTYSSSCEEMSRISNKVVGAEGLPDPETPQITSIPFPHADTEYQTKREVDYTLFDFESTDMEFGAGKMVKAIGQNLDLSDTETRNPSYSSSCEEMSRISNKVIAAEGLPDPETPQITNISFPTLEGLASSDFYENSNVFNYSRENMVESITPDPSLSRMPNVHAPSSDKIERSLSKSREVDTETSSTSPIQFWTNGGLLGLEPSKPPDCSLSNVPSQRSSDDTKVGLHDVSNNSVVPRSHSDESVGKLEKELDSVGVEVKSSDSISPVEDHLVKNVENMVQPVHQSQCSTSCNGQQNDCASGNEVPFESSVSESIIKKSEASHNNSSHAPELPVVKTSLDESGQENNESLSNMLDIGPGLLVNGFRRKSSFHEERYETASSVKNCPVMLQEPFQNEQMKGKAQVENQTSLERTPKGQTGCVYPENSPSSSPPLEYMNISFHSINGFETSKLKLKFPDGHRFHENIRDVVFPSFQLLPEHSTQQYVDSESDDDTFCRSSPCTSEDLLRHHSESSSGQWESGDSSGSDNEELADVLHRVSSVESMSASLEHFHSGPSLDLPSFDAFNPLMDQHVSISSSVLMDIQKPQLQHCNESQALLPSLPSLQFRTVMPQLDTVEGRRGATSDVVDHPNGQLFPSSTNSQKPPVPSKPPQIEEATECPVNEKELNESTQSREANQAANVKEVEEREDLMCQIRKKQFNLKRTIPSRKPLSPDAPTNVKVAAILEKADAIRQACVGSDEGTDENWSDD